MVKGFKPLTTQSSDDQPINMGGRPKLEDPVMEMTKKINKLDNEINVTNDRD